MGTVVKEDEKEPKLSQNENDYTEQYKGLIMLRRKSIEKNIKRYWEKKSKLPILQKKVKKQVIHE